jgi:pumilio homology domain family member 6
MFFLIQGEASEGATDVASENKVDAAADIEHGILEGTQIASESKKDPSQRRHELLIKSGLAEVMFIHFLYEK